MHPTFKEAFNALELLRAQCGNARLRTLHGDVVLNYLYYAGIAIEQLQSRSIDLPVHLCSTPLPVMWDGMSDDDIEYARKRFKSLHGKRDE